MEFSDDHQQHGDERAESRDADSPVADSPVADSPDADPVLPTMTDLDRLAADLDRVDATLEELDQGVSNEGSFSGLRVSGAGSSV